MKLVVNGVEHRLDDGIDVAALVRRFGSDPDRPGTAVARNGAVVPRREWAGTPLADGDRVEVVRATGGG